MLCQSGRHLDVVWWSLYTGWYFVCQRHVGWEGVWTACQMPMFMGRTVPSGHRPSDQAKLLGLWVRLWAARVYTHHHHLSLLLSPKGDTHFTAPWRVEGCINLGGRLHQFISVHVQRTLELVNISGLIAYWDSLFARQVDVNTDTLIYSTCPILLISNICITNSWIARILLIPNFLGCESACGLPESTPTITIYYYYSAQKVILILLPHEG